MKKNTEQEVAGNGCIDKNGVLLLMRGDACMDIQVKPQAEEVDFGDMEHIYLKNLDNETPFPNVKRLKISGDGIKYYVSECPGNHIYKPEISIRVNAGRKSGK